MSDYEQIKTEVDENGIMVLTLHRPDAMNAFTGRMMYEIVDAFDKADADDNGAIIMTGDGAHIVIGIGFIESVNDIVHHPPGKGVHRIGAMKRQHRNAVLIHLGFNLFII